MTPLVDRITAVLRQHSSLDDDEWDRCECGEPTQPGGWAAHVAVAVAEALQLREERIHAADPLYEPNQRRWVSAWTAVEDKP